MTTLSPAAETAEVTEIDTSARYSLLLLLGSAVVWLLVSGVLALVSLVQIYTPSFLADCVVFTHGRTQAMQETTFIYGWAANAGLAVTLWILGRLGGSPLRSLNWVVVGTLFWNFSITLGLAGIATGDATSNAWLHLPRYVLPLMLVAYGAIAAAGVLAWTGRRQQMTFASQWYAVAALFLFPWIFSIAQMQLVFAPERGVLQALVAGWFVQGAWTLWLAPLAVLGVGVGLLDPTAHGRVVVGVVAADLVQVGRLGLGLHAAAQLGVHLIGGPVPAWVATIAVVSCALLLFHYIVVAINLRGAFSGGGSAALKFVAFGLAAYVAGGFLDAATAMRSLAAITQFTHFTDAQSQLALNGAFSMMIYGAVYFMGPRIMGRVWPSAGLIRAHYGLAAVGVIVLFVSLAGGGWIQGHDLKDPHASFAAIAGHVRPWLVAATAAQALLLLGNLLLAVNLLRLGSARAASSDPIVFRQPPTMEASVS